jgi:hypothetical protein
MLTLVAGVIYLMFGSATGSILPWKGPKEVADAQLVNAIAIGLALFLGAAAVGLLTWSHTGVWLGRIAAGVIAALGAYFIWWVVFIDESAFRSMSLIFLGGLGVVLLLVAAGVLFALRGRRSDRPPDATPS